ncbi:MAG TPA: OsmC family protein [Candidatus Dormibacteraeota bacterium]
MNVREIQKPLKDGYREHPESSRITLVARGGEGEAPVACSVDLGRAIYEAQAHAGVGGAGTGACSGDLLLGALAACAQVTCQMVAASMELATEEIRVTVEGDVDLSGTLGINNARVGFETIRLQFEIVAPEATQEQVDSLIEKTKRYCVVLQTLMAPPAIETNVVSRVGAAS